MRVCESEYGTFCACFRAVAGSCYLLLALVAGVTESGLAKETCVFTKCAIIEMEV